MDHEEAFVSVFVVPEKRARYLEFLRKPKRRWEMLNRLNHFFDFIPHLATPAVRNANLADELRRRGAGDTAYVIGGSDGFDGRELTLDEAVMEAMTACNGVVISCVPGRLALYLQEFPPGDAFVLSCTP
jgi:hypothetical protein